MIEELSNRLWGSIISEFSFSLNNNELILKIKIIENNEETFYNIAFKKVIMINYSTQAEEYWDYTELTSITFIKNVDKWEIKMNLWDLSYFDIICKQVFVNNIEVEYTSEI